MKQVCLDKEKKIREYEKERKSMLKHIKELEIVMQQNGDHEQQDMMGTLENALACAQEIIEDLEQEKEAQVKDLKKRQREREALLVAEIETLRKTVEELVYEPEIIGKASPSIIEDREAGAREVDGGITVKNTSPPSPGMPTHSLKSSTRRDTSKVGAKAGPSQSSSRLI